MYEKNLQNQKISSTKLTPSAPRQEYRDLAERDNDIRQGETRIFKYPYLAERSNEKIRQENDSEKSGSRHVARTHLRRKIFEPKSTVESEMKHSTMSADHVNRSKPTSNFESNPVRHKIKNSRNKSIATQNEQASNSQGLPLQHTVNFKYCTPHEQFSYPHPALSYMAFSGNNYRESSKIEPLIPQPYVSFLERNLSKGYASVPVGVDNQRPPLIMSSNQFRQQYQTFPIQPQVASIQQVQINNQQFALSPSTYKEIPKQHIPNRLKCVKSTAHTSTIVQNRPTIDKQEFPSKPISWIPLKREDNKNEHHHHHRQQQHDPRFQEMAGLVKKESPPKHFQTEQNVNRNMYETYKIGQRFKKHNFLHPSSGEGLNKKLQNLPSISSFTSANIGQDDDSVDLHEAEELDNLYLEEGKYSDRFFDMDFKETKKQQHPHHDHKAPVNDLKDTKHNVLEESVSLKKISSERKGINEKKQSTLTKKGSINSIALEKESLKKLELEKEQSQKLLRTDNLMNKMVVEGKLVTIILIGIGILLVVVQILR